MRKKEKKVDLDDGYAIVGDYPAVVTFDGKPIANMLIGNRGGFYGLFIDGSDKRTRGWFGSMKGAAYEVKRMHARRKH